MNRLDAFDIIIRQRNANAIATVPQLGLYAQGPDVNSALELLERKKRALLSDLDAGVVDADLILAPVGMAAPGVRTANVGIFAIKAGILIMLATFGVLVAATLVSAKLENVIDRVRLAAESSALQFMERSFWSKFESYVDRIADPANEPSAERKQKLQANIRIIADRWRPIVREAMSVVSDDKSSRSGEGAKPAQ